MNPNIEAQYRFQQRLNKTKKITAKQLPMKHDVSHIDDLMSDEMKDWLTDQLLEDEEGMLNDAVSSQMTPPLDGASLFTPMASLIKSQYAAERPKESLNEAEKRKRTKILRHENSFDDISMAERSFESGDNTLNQSLDQYDSNAFEPASSILSDFPDNNMNMNTQKMDDIIEAGSFASNANDSMASTASIATTWSLNKVKDRRPKGMLVNDAMKRLEVMWMKRKADIERGEGNQEQAFASLNTALEIHLGSPPPKAGLASHKVDEVQHPTNVPYEEAKLGDYGLTHAEGLYSYIGTKFIEYDKHAHWAAGRVQRCYLRYMRRRSRYATVLQSWYRGCLTRLKLYNQQQQYIQTVQIIQRAFRRYLGLLFKMSNRIKRWYTKLKIMEFFKEDLFYHRKAYRIQRLYRGYTGRQVAWFKRKQRDSTSLIQRQARAWNIKRQREQALVLYFRRFNEKAIIIQCLIRRVQAIRRSQMQLLFELSREEERFEREQSIVEEAVKVQLKKTHLYLQTDAGALHFQITKHRINIHDQDYYKRKSTLSDEEIATHEAMVAFELFDTDGSGQIDQDELTQMLKQLAIPMDEEGVAKLYKEIDTDGGGDIDFGEFIEWYGHGGSDEVESSATLEDRLFKQMLRARTFILEATGVILARRAERDIVRQCTHWMTKDIAAAFRNSHAPKYQCCQCMECFTLFADYEDHFDHLGHCEVLHTKAYYFTSYWKARDWEWQRQIEHEVRRNNDEVPCVNYHCMMACLLDLSLQYDHGVDMLVKQQAKRAQQLFLNKRNPEGSENTTANTSNKEKDNSPFRDGLSLVDEIVSIVNICGDDHLSPLVVKIVSEKLNAAIPSEWVVTDTWTLENFRTWVSEVVDGEKGFSNKTPLIPLCESDHQKMMAETWLLGDLYVRVLRILQVTAESSLMALMDFRGRRPRKMTIPDDTLMQLDGLQHITESAYIDRREKTLTRLKICNEYMERLALVQLPRDCLSMFNPIKQSKIGPNGKLSAEDIKANEISDAHIRAYAKYRAKLKSKLGRTQLHRLANEMWATHMQDRVDGMDIAHREGVGHLVKTRWDVSKMGDVQFIYSRYSSESTGDGLDFDDLDLLEESMNVSVREAQLPDFKRDLDPENSGFVTLPALAAFLLKNIHHKYWSSWQYLKNGFKRVTHSLLTLTSYYNVYAEHKLLANIRKLSRIELDFQRKSIQKLLLSAEIMSEREKEKDLERELKTSANPTSSEELAQARKMTAEQREAAAQMKAEQMNKKEDRVANLGKDIDDYKEKMLLMKGNDDQGESLLLYRLEENEAESACKASFFTARGFYNLWKERDIMNGTHSLIDAYGYCIAPGSMYPWTAGYFKPNKGEKKTGENVGNIADEKHHAAGWDLALSALIYAFDTDCSGGFDEGEVKLLLACANCGLSEREVIYTFPEVLEDSADVQTLIRYMAPRVLWARGKMSRLGYRGGLSIQTHFSLTAASSMLISLSRQRARAAAEEATALSRTGALVEEEEEKNDQAIMIRSQLFALRQNKLFLQTIQGKYKLRETIRKVKYWWTEDVYRIGTREAVFNYAYLLHKEYNGILITEMPHLIRYLCKYMNFTTNAHINELGERVNGVKNKSDVVWLDRTEVMTILETCFNKVHCVYKYLVQYPHLYVNRMISITRDAKVHMKSKARQQAVLISLQCEGILVSESNYRCSVLGLQETIHQMNQESSWGILRKKKKWKVDWKNVPREALPFLLMSHGYEYTDLTIGNIPQWAESEHKSGGIGADTVNVVEALAECNAELKTHYSGWRGMLSQGKRWINFFTQASGGLVSYMRYRRITKAVSGNGKEVNRNGAKYLREILSGQSHCVAETEE